MAPPLKPKNSLSEDPRFAQAVQSYEAGLRSLQERKFEKAKAAFQKVVGSGVRELIDRAGVHLNTCNQHLEISLANGKRVDQFKCTHNNPVLRNGAPDPARWLPAFYGSCNVYFGGAAAILAIAIRKLSRPTE